MMHPLHTVSMPRRVGCGAAPPNSRHDDASLLSNWFVVINV